MRAAAEAEAPRPLPAGCARGALRQLAAGEETWEGRTSSHEVTALSLLSLLVDDEALPVGDTLRLSCASAPSCGALLPLLSRAFLMRLSMSWCSWKYSVRGVDMCVPPTASVLAVLVIWCCGVAVGACRHF